jgi:hypothetical protein
MQTIENAKTKERIFLLCDQCLWAVTCLDKKYLEELCDISDTEFACPSCKRDQLSSFPLTANDSFRYNYSDKKGIEITFGN